jgi:DNA-binding winged helix-turn-helix (wHTH) protein
LRRALRDGRDGNRFIINIPGRGYRFVASIHVSMQELVSRKRPS